MPNSYTPLKRRSYDQKGVEAIAHKYRTWGQWGDDDELGSSNYVTTERVAAAASTIKRGVVFSLSLPMDTNGPQTGQTRRINPQHLMLRTPRDHALNDGGLQKFTDDSVYMPLQSSTQWDALSHVFYDGTTYNGRGVDSVTAQGAEFNSITNFKHAAGRGVLLDIARDLGRSWLDAGESVQKEDLEQCADRQGVEVGEGDYVLVRTGQMAFCRDRGSWGDYAGGPAPGLGLSAAEFLCERHVAAVATDTWGMEVKPYECETLIAPMHIILLVNAGLLVGEMWDLDELASDCADDHVYEFFLTAPPLMISGAVGSPLNPLAIK